MGRASRKKSSGRRPLPLCRSRGAVRGPSRARSRAEKGRGPPEARSGGAGPPKRRAQGRAERKEWARSGPDGARTSRRQTNSARGSAQQTLPNDDEVPRQRRTTGKGDYSPTVWR